MFYFLNETSARYLNCQWYFFQEFTFDLFVKKKKKKQHINETKLIADKKTNGLFSLCVWKLGADETKIDEENKRKNEEWI